VFSDSQLTAHIKGALPAPSSPLA